MTQQIKLQSVLKMFLTMAELPLRRSTPPEFIPFFLPHVRPNSPLAILHPPPGYFLKQTGRRNKMTSGSEQEVIITPPENAHIYNTELRRLGPVERPHGVKGLRSQQSGSPQKCYQIKTKQQMNSFKTVLEAEILKGQFSPNILPVLILSAVCAKVLASDQGGKVPQSPVGQQI